MTMKRKCKEADGKNATSLPGGKLLHDIDGSGRLPAEYPTSSDSDRDAETAAQLAPSK
jgi:hypothetical protein